MTASSLWQPIEIINCFYYSISFKDNQLKQIDLFIIVYILNKNHWVGVFFKPIKATLDYSSINRYFLFHDATLKKIFNKKVKLNLK